MRKVFLTIVILATAGITLSAQTKKKKVTPTKSPAVTAAIMANGKKIYQQYCLSCHMTDGAGVPNMNPPLIKTPHILGDKNRLIKVVLNGLSTGEEIDGEIYTNVMPPHNFLKDEEVAAVLSYVRNSFGNKATTVSAAEVKVLRSKQ